jgi:hypothetical protein
MVTRRRGRAALALLLIPVLLTGCDAAGDDESSDDGELGPAAQASATALPGGLGAAGLAGREAEGFVVTAAKAPAVKVAESACVPAGHALSGTVIGEPVSTVVRRASGEDADVLVVLAEYKGEQAQSAMDALATAAGVCADGFGATVDGEERGFGKLTPELAPEGADQALGLGAVVARDGAKSPVKAVVLRKGNTVAYISAVPTTPAPKNFSVPTAVIAAQLTKLP